MKSQKTLGLIHTSATLVPVFADLCNQYLPGVKLFNIVDDSLIKNTIAAGKLTPDTAKRVVHYVGSAQDAGADFILVTCSSIGAAVEAAALLQNVPVLRVDQPMADQAILTGKRIGIIATLSTTLEPTSDLVKRRAVFLKKEIEITALVCEGAFEALMSGNAVLHDAAVATVLKELMPTVDVILLAQASMARVADALTASEKSVPVLSSPFIAVQHIARILNA
jgi:Asp/Glu/hydantoin racemase